MLILGLVIFVAVGVFLFIGTGDTDDLTYPAVPIAIILVFIAINGVILVNSKDVDERIAMYEEQNAKIEAQVSEAVELYMTHEDEVFDKAKADSSITLVSLYPELKSDTLMQELTSTYTDNNKKICELKEEKITAKRAKFWLYFGR